MVSNWIFEGVVEDKGSLKFKRWSKIHLKHRRVIRHIGELGVIPPTKITSVKEWVNGWSRTKIVNIVDWLTNI